MTTRRKHRTATDQQDTDRSARKHRKGKRENVTAPSGRAQRRVLAESVRAELTGRVARGGFRASIARARLRRDDNMRRLVAAEQAAALEHPFDMEQLTLTDRGFKGRGGGRASAIGRQPEVRGTTIQSSGMYPWATGAPTSRKGTPVGIHLESEQLVHFDAMSWFLNGRITAPIAFVLALNGFGKSSLIRRLVAGAQAKGYIPFVLGDVKPDQVTLIRALGGQIIALGYGAGCVNPLAVGALGSVIDRLPVAMQAGVLQEVRARQVRIMAGLIEIGRRSGRVDDYEETVIAAGLRHLYSPAGGFTPQRPPLIEDLLAVISTNAEVMHEAVEASDHAEYLRLVGPLRRSLRSLITGPFGEVFNGHTTEPIDIDCAGGVCVDVSKIRSNDVKLKAAVLMVCWSEGFSAVEAAHTLADAGITAQRNFTIVMDELWQVLGAGAGMVDRVNELTRLNRGDGAELYMISHTVNDLAAFESMADVNKALGFLDRARVKIIGPIPEAEIDALAGKIKFTDTEREQLVAWASDTGIDDDDDEFADHRQERIPYGMGKFLIKTGESDQAGLPFQLRFTFSEWETGIHATNSRFDDLKRRNRDTLAPTGESA